MTERKYSGLRDRIVKLNQEALRTWNERSALEIRDLTAGALSDKHRDLLAVGIAICTGGEGAVAFRVHDAMAAGASSQEIVETIGVALLMGGGTALMRSLEAIAAIQEFEAKQLESRGQL